MKENWKQISGLYHSVLKLPENERATFLKKHAPSEDVRLEVESLLAHEGVGEQLLESPALEVASKMTADENPVLMTGRTLGHYRVADLLGKGGMGEVYLAKDLRLGRDVAIKVLPQDFAKNEDRVARFQREAKLLASLNHPHICTIYDIDEYNGHHFIAMELIDRALPSRAGGRCRPRIYASRCQSFKTGSGGDRGYSAHHRAGRRPGKRP